MKSIAMRLHSNEEISHEIQIGRDIMDRMALSMLRARWASRYVLVTDKNVASLHASQVMEVLRATGLEVDMLDLPPGEGSKAFKACSELIHRLLLLEVDRECGLVALGGGVVGDLTGFVASIYMRGIPYIQVPTTLLAQVDSSIGGKTGVDLEEGKNLIGTFHQPKGIFVDLSFLDTLPQEQIAEGLAEVIKYGLVEDPEIFSLVESNPALSRNQDTEAMEQIVTRCCAIKRSFVEMDQWDRGVRRILNFGHTVGHAVEAQSAYTISHGQAVSIGMVAAMRISAKVGPLSMEEVLRLENLLGILGLPVRLPPGISASAVMARMHRDKKRQGERIPLVLLRAPGLPFLNDSVPVHLVEEALEELGS